MKTNIGHLEAAAGMAGLLKLVLSVEHGEMPAHLHYESPSPHIDWEGTCVEVCAQRREWPLPRGTADRRGELVRVQRDQCPRDRGVSGAGSEE